MSKIAVMGAGVQQRAAGAGGVAAPGSPQLEVLCECQRPSPEGCRPNHLPDVSPVSSCVCLYIWVHYLKRAPATMYV